MDITQTFYDNMASQYDKLFLDWNATTQEQAVILNKIFNNNGFSTNAHILDCACGIGMGSAWVHRVLVSICLSRGNYLLRCFHYGNSVRRRTFLSLTKLSPTRSMHSIK